MLSKRCRISGFVSGHRFSDAVPAAPGPAPLGAVTLSPDHWPKQRRGGAALQGRVKREKCEGALAPGFSVALLSSGVISGHRFIGCGMTRVRTRVGKGTSLLVPQSRRKCVGASAPGVSCVCSHQLSRKFFYAAIPASSPSAPLAAVTLAAATFCPYHWPGQHRGGAALQGRVRHAKEMGALAPLLAFTQSRLSSF